MNISFGPKSAEGAGDGASGDGDGQVLEVSGAAQRLSALWLSARSGALRRQFDFCGGGA